MSTERDAGRESTEPLTPARLAEIAEDHWQANTGQHAGRCDFCGDGWPCGPKLLLAEVDRLAEALAAEQARVQRVEAVRALIGAPRVWVIDGPDIGRMKVVGMLDRALAGDTEGAGR